VAEASDAAERELRRQLATLIYSQLTPALPADAITAAGWWNLTARLGCPLPLVVVHDFGLVLTSERLGGARQVRRDGGRAPSPLNRYQALLARVATSEAVSELGAAPLRDEILAVILARVLGDVYLRWAPRGLAPAELPTASALYEADRDALAAALRQRNVPFVAVDSLLGGRDWRALRFPRDSHWNVAGHQAVGQALAPVVRPLVHIAG